MLPSIDGEDSDYEVRTPIASIPLPASAPLIPFDSSGSWDCAGHNAW